MQRLFNSTKRFFIISFLHLLVALHAIVLSSIENEDEGTTTVGSLVSLLLAIE